MAFEDFKLGVFFYSDKVQDMLSHKIGLFPAYDGVVSKLFQILMLFVCCGAYNHFNTVGAAFSNLMLTFWLV